MKINFIVPSELMAGILRLAPILGIECDPGGTVLRAIRSDKIGASLLGNTGTVYYREKHHFFRELGVFVENARESESFEVFEDGSFKTVGLMFAASYAVPKISDFKRYIDYMALMGYNMLMFYTEDTLELPGREFFGYMQSRYSKSELSELDDYAYEYGIEMLPCLECYGHMQKYLFWDEAEPIKDTTSVLLAREPETFAFLEELITEASAPYRSKRIHIGMDEAWNMGRGKFLDKNGFVPPFEIFKEYMQTLVGITEKHGLVPMMWSDMYMRISSKTGWPYDKDIEITDELRASVPEGVDLVFWHYGEDPGCDKYMLEKHNALNRNVIMATGLWDWSTKLPDNKYALETTRASLDACRKTSVSEMMTTKWGSMSPWLTLLGLSFTAELCYNPDISDGDIKARFDFLTDGAYEAFDTMSQFNNIFDENHSYTEDYTKRFLGNALYWQDVLEGSFDTHLFSQPMSAHYAAQAEKLSAYRGKFEKPVRYAEQVFSMIAKKCEIAEQLWPAYGKGDKATLEKIKDELLPELIRRTELVYSSESELYLESFKQANLSRIDAAYGTLLARAKTAIRLLGAYLSGELSEIEALSEKRLHRAVNGFLPYSKIAFVTP